MIFLFLVVLSVGTNLLSSHSSPIDILHTLNNIKAMVTWIMYVNKDLYLRLLNSLGRFLNIPSHSQQLPCNLLLSSIPPPLQGCSVSQCHQHFLPSSFPSSEFINSTCYAEKLYWLSSINLLSYVHSLIKSRIKIVR